MPAPRTAETDAMGLVGLGRLGVAIGALGTSLWTGAVGRRSGEGGNCGRMGESMARQ